VYNWCTWFDHLTCKWVFFEILTVVLWLKKLIFSQSGKMLDLIKIDNERIY